MIVPTVGRVVWFYRWIGGPGHEGPLAAHVCHVHKNGRINVMVISEVGNTTGWLDIELVQDGCPVPNEDHCTWMPYQVGQSAKTAEVAKRLETLLVAQGPS